MNILHLSDIHFGRNYPQYGIGDAFDRHDEILEELIQVIADTDEHLRPQHILFTGDIVWHGKSAEYRQALAWFRRLLAALDLTGKDISFCVGNHDLDLACNCDDPGIDNDSVEEIDRCYRYENIHKMDAPLYGYNEFCRDIGMEPYCYPLDGKLHYSYSAGYKDVTFPNGKTVRLLALNTAMLMPFKGISEDKMWLGLEQIKSLIHHGILPAPKDIWYTITLCHHSDRFLHPDETSTYNGRPATLPLLLENVNLILCGHTESSGKPRLSKQQGGGKILCGGAAYYSDDHINAFSMIYLSEKRRTMGFLPYVYEDGWQDYDFEHSSIQRDDKAHIDDTGSPMTDVKAVFSSDADSFCIDCQYLELDPYEVDGNRFIRFNNHKDLMNPFCIEYDSALSINEPVRISLADTGKFSARTNLAYKQFSSFAEASKQAEHLHCELIDPDGRKLLDVTGFSASDPCRYDDQFLNEILQLEDTFHVRFKLPDSITKSDLKKIRLLKKLSELGYAENAMLSGEVKKVMNREEMQALYDAAVKDNQFCVRTGQSFRIHLFDVTLDLGNITVYATPFYVDLSDLSHKLETFCDGDQRVCSFIPGIDLTVYLVRDRMYQELVKTHSIPAGSEIQNIESIDLTIDL